MFHLNNLKPARGATKRRKRVGRGQGSGSGTTAGKGYKGQNSRAGGGVPHWFEGGQMPLYRRVPKRGFFSRNRVENQIVNLIDFDRLDVSRDIDIDYLRERGFVSGREPRVKILGSGEVEGAFKVRVHAISASARAKIEEKGGAVEILPWGTAAAKAAGASGK